MDLTTRHPGTVALLRNFRYDHLPPHLQLVSRPMGQAAIEMCGRLQDGPELTTGLRKLLEAKDCFVRQAVADGETDDPDRDAWLRGAHHPDDDRGVLLVPPGMVNDVVRQLSTMPNAPEVREAPGWTSYSPEGEVLSHSGGAPEPLPVKEVDRWATAPVDAAGEPGQLPVADKFSIQRVDRLPAGDLRPTGQPVAARNLRVTPIDDQGQPVGPSYTAPGEQQVTYGDPGDDHLIYDHRCEHRDGEAIADGVPQWARGRQCIPCAKKRGQAQL